MHKFSLEDLIFVLGFTCVIAWKKPCIFKGRTIAVDCSEISETHRQAYVTSEQDLTKQI